MELTCAQTVTMAQSQGNGPCASPVCRLCLRVEDIQVADDSGVGDLQSTLAR